MKELGIVRSLLLAALLCAGMAALCKMESKWAAPAAYLLVIGYHHQTRKDRDFLLHLTDNLTGFFMKEYLLISLPFILLTILRGDWLIALCIPLAACLLSFTKPIHPKRRPIRMRLLYPGNMEYIRMFRRNGWAYILLVTFSLAGCVHGNTRIAKVCMLLWTVLQSGAYCQIPDPHLFLKFKSHFLLQKLTWESNVWNVTIPALPFAFMLPSSGHWPEELLFMTFYLASSILYMQGIALWHWVCHSEMALFAAQLTLFVPLFAAGCFIPHFILVSATCTGILSYLIRLKGKAIWKR